MKVSKDKLDIVMANAGVSMLELSQKTGCTPSTLTKIKKGTIKESRPITIGKIAKALDVDVSEIIE